MPIIGTKPEDANETAKKAKTIYGEVGSGDWVVATGNNDYRYLVGTVTAIEKAGATGHGAANETDDIHVDFTAFGYPKERISEIEWQFSALYGVKKTFSELPLDDVIMAPEMLIRITHLGNEEITRMGDARQNCEAFCNCFPGGGGLYSELQARFMERIEKNLMDYHASLAGFGNRELIEIAGRISAWSDAYSYMCFHGLGDDELRFFLQFESPLEILADEWHEHRIGLEDMSFAMEHIKSNRSSLLEGYPLASEGPQTEIPGKPVETQEPSEKAGQDAEKATPKTLAEKMKAANEKAKAQEAHKNNNLKSRNREER